MLFNSGEIEEINHRIAIWVRSQTPGALENILNVSKLINNW